MELVMVMDMNMELIDYAFRIECIIQVVKTHFYLKRELVKEKLNQWRDVLSHNCIEQCRHVLDQLEEP